MASVLTNAVLRGAYVPAGKAPVALAADSNVDISSLVSGPPMDGVAVPAGARVLLTGQTVASENGIYDVFTTGAVRSVDLVAGEQGCGTFVYVALGTVYAATIWVCGSYGAVVGTDALIFRRIGRPGLVSSPLVVQPYIPAPTYVDGWYYGYVAAGYRQNMALRVDYDGTDLEVQVVNVTTNTTIAASPVLTAGGQYKLVVPIPVASARLLVQARAAASAATIYSLLLEYDEV